MKPITTFSIVAYDPKQNAWGVAVQSKFMAVGAVVSWGRAGAGVVATQSFANLMYGPEGIDLMATGKSAEEVIEVLTERDRKRALRQVGMVDKDGNSASYTGSECFDWAGSITGDGYACQGNMLVPGTVEAIANAFETEREKGDGELADWLVSALEAGQKAGGDKRGKQSAAILIVKENGGYGGNNDRYMDLRVDDHPHPITELRRLVEMHHVFFGETRPEDLIDISTVTEYLQHILSKTGYYKGPIDGIFDETTRQSLIALVGAENLEERWDGDGDKIDQVAVNYLKKRFK